MITSAAPHDHLAEPAAPIAGDQAERAADQQRERDRGGGDRERVLGGDDDPREDAAAERIGAQHVEPAVARGVNGGALRPRRFILVAASSSSAGPNSAHSTMRPR